MLVAALVTARRAAARDASGPPVDGDKPLNQAPTRAGDSCGATASPAASAYAPPEFAPTLDEAVVRAREAGTLLVVLTSTRRLANLDCAEH